jgi:hypothetical protein
VDILFRKLFAKKNLSVIDGDNRLDACTDGRLQNKLLDIIYDGLKICGVQIFHYAAVKYNTRFDSFPPRFLNALFATVSSISDKRMNLTLDSLEEQELKRDSSEVIAVGLSNMFMCRWYGVNINRIEKIPGSGKRCGFRFPAEDKVVVFETKGREKESQVKNALYGCVRNKWHYSANYMYSTIARLPRDGSPVCLILFDPPSVNNGAEINEKYLTAKHYRNVAKLSGLTILADKINKKIRQYERTGEWSSKPLWFGKVLEFGSSVTVENNSFRTGRNSSCYERKDEKYYFWFGLDERVIDLLKKWDLDELLKYDLKETVLKKQNISLLPDGSLFYIGNKKLF